MRVGDRAGEREELAVLVVVVPRVVGEATRAEPRDAGAERGILEQARRRAARDHQAVGRARRATARRGCRGTVRRPLRRARRGRRRGSASRRSACPTMRRDQPAARAAAAPATNSVSPTGASSAGPSVRYAAWHSMNTVALDAVPAADVGEQVGEAVRAAAAGGPQVMVRVDDALLGIDDRPRPRARATRRNRDGRASPAHRSRSSARPQPAPAGHAVSTICMRRIADRELAERPTKLARRRVPRSARRARRGRPTARRRTAGWGPRRRGTRGG